MKKLLYIFTACLIPLFLFSREITIKVYDKDIEIPLEGVTIIERETGSTVITDEEGKAILDIPDSATKLILSMSAIGYEPSKQLIKDFPDLIKVEMSIEGTLEGGGLVVEEEAIGTSDEEAGISKVVEKEELQATAMVGVVEDVMSSIKVLPGVSYAGKFNANLSVRGGDSDGLTCMLDGFMVRYPYHWGGAFSIFNPNMVDSVKFSAGIFNAKYGLATSGIMEVNSVTPDDGFKMNIITSTSTYEIFLQTPVGLKNAGILVGGRITNYDFAMAIMAEQLRQQGISYSRTPYIYDAYFKWFWKPVERFEWYVNSFFGSDGIGLTAEMKQDLDGDKKEILDRTDFYWQNWDTFVSTGFKILPTDSLFIHFLVGYEFYRYQVNAKLRDYGTKDYSDEFMAEYGPILGGATSFTIDNESRFENSTTLHGLQSRIDFDITLHDKIMLSVGTGFLFDIYLFDASGKTWSTEMTETGPVYRKVNYENDAENNKRLASFGMVNFAFTILPKQLEIDLGCRIDHNIIYGSGFVVNTYPVASPRFNIRYTPVRGAGALEHITLSAGVGIFSKIPSGSLAASQDLDIGDFEFKPPKSLTSVLGIEFGLPLGFKFSIEGYYKYMFDLFYVNSTTDTDGKRTFHTHTDGFAHAAGFDLMLERRISRYIDGLFSFSFIYVRRLNPETDGVFTERTMQGDPTNQWYYPSYHRFVTLNAVLNIKPVSFMTITPKLSFATGRPRREDGEKQMYFARIGEEVIELYSADRTYSDTLRQEFSIPFDLKVAFHFFVPKAKLRLETYVAVEDLFCVVYRPRSGIRTNLYTGEETESRTEMTSAMGVPVFSFGFKMNF